MASMLVFDIVIYLWMWLVTFGLGHFFISSLYHFSDFYLFSWIISVENIIYLKMTYDLMDLTSRTSKRNAKHKLDNELFSVLYQNNFTVTDDVLT